MMQWIGAIYEGKLNDNGILLTLLNAINLGKELNTEHKIKAF